MEEVVYSAESQLRSRARFVAETWSDLRVSPRLAWRLFLHSLRANYRRSWLGYLWLLAPPLATAATWVFLNAARVPNVGPTETPYAVYVLSGTMLWQVFADAINSPLQQLSNARAILTKSRAPHEALLLAGLIEVLFNLSVRLLVLLPVLVWFGPQLSLTLAALAVTPLGVAALLLLLGGASGRGEVLRYAGTIEETGRASAALRPFPAGHAFANLQGSDNVVSFRTARYDAQPMIARGPGAGPEVTAAGVFSDLLRLATFPGAPQ